MTTIVTPGVVSPTSTTYPRDRFHRNAETEDNKFIPINQNVNGCDKTKEMDDDAETTPRRSDDDADCGEEDDDEDDEDDEEEDDDRQVNRTHNIEDDVALLRPRNKRKNFQPRPIVAELDESSPSGRRRGSAKTEVMDLRLSARDGLVDDSDSDASSSRLAADLKSYRHVKNAAAASAGLLSLLTAESGLNNPFGIDLSRFRAASVSHASTGAKKTSESGSYGGSDSGDLPPIPQPGEISAMKEYAENTMRELLSIYGLNNMEMNELITNNVDISNFTAGKILEKCDGFGLSLLAQPPTPPRTPLSPILVKPRRSDSPQEDDGETENVDQLRGRISVADHVAASRIPMMLPGGIPFLSSFQDTLKECLDEDSSPPPQQSSVLMEPKGPRLSSSPNRENKNTIVIDYSKYVRKFNTSTECASSYCKDLNYREHFHCLDCSGRVFVKKEEMIRHFKWHKKRDESLQHGFLRYSPMDDCNDRYSNCQHNRKQTHYHCVHEGCDKTYISTSDVQMHANYHRKDSAIIQEGFQRFRATEECLTPHCAFFGQRTTHFHCRRDNCQFTFKNKADMEKHKSYHIKDEQLSRDGFKKFMKNEACGFESCRFSRISNHIHCIRSNCSYVLHSSGQLLSHKRKHERKDSELAYRKFKLTQSVMKSLQDGVPINLEQLEAASLEHSQMSNGEYSSDGGQSSPPILPPGFNRFGALHANYEALTQSYMLPSNLQALQKVQQLDNLQKMHEIDTPGKYATKTDVSERHDTLEKLPDLFKSSELLQKFPELLLKSPELMQKLPEIMMRYPKPTESFSKHEEKRRTECDAGPMDLSNDNSKIHEEKHHGDDVWTKYLKPFSASETCVDGSSCEDSGRDHFHCITEGCRIVFRTKDAVKEHGRNHAEQDRVTESSFVTVMEASCRYDSECEVKSKHYHCTWEGCREVLFPTDIPFLRLDHVRQHEAARMRLPQPHLSTSLDAMFRRKRGRPPKNRVIEVWNDNVNQTSGLGHDSPQAIFTSFKLPKPSLGLTRLISGSPVVDLTHEGSASPAAERSRESSPIQLEGFYSSDGDNCSEIHCRHNRQHLHCSHPRCIFSTDRPSNAAQHKEFHERITILDNFIHYDRLSDCKTQACLHNKIARHFHCTRPGCNFSFLRSSTMLLHESNHLRNGEGEVPLTKELEHEQAGEEETDGRQEQPVSPTDCSTSPTKTTDDTNKSKTNQCSSSQLSPENLSQRKEEGKIQPASPSKLFPPNYILNPNTPDGDSQNPLSKLMKLQNEATKSMQIPKNEQNEMPSRDFVPEYMTLERHIRYGLTENCSRPFCKLKRKDHFHCNACNQAFSEQEKLRHHIARHSSGAMSPGVKKEPEDNNNEDPEDIPSQLGHPTMPNFELDPSANPFQHPFGGFPLPPSLNAAFAQQLNMMQGQSIMFQPSALYGTPAGLMFGAHALHPHHPLANGLHPAMLDVEQAQAMHQHLTNLSLASSAAKRTLSPPPLADLSQEAKKARVQNSMRILKDEPVPEGYVRYRFNEDCKYPHCGYREHQTHFHCMRKDCGYSFCDKTRFVQHTARHERLDTLMGGDFQQYRANVSCNRADCVYATALGTVQNKASHFHCIKCDFVCTDTNKVVAHRRQHQKLDSINAAGFEKYTPSQLCSTEGCSHSGKQTHYHCLSCQYAVLGLSQMSAHKYRHLE